LIALLDRIASTWESVLAQPAPTAESPPSSETDRGELAVTRLASHLEGLSHCQEAAEACVRPAEAALRAEAEAFRDWLRQTREAQQQLAMAVTRAI
jgi:hypothetical protein